MFLEKLLKNINRCSNRNIQVLYELHTSIIQHAASLKSRLANAQLIFYESTVESGCRNIWPIIFQCHISRQVLDVGFMYSVVCIINGYQDTDRFRSNVLLIGVLKINWKLYPRWIALMTSLCFSFSHEPFHVRMRKLKRNRFITRVHNALNSGARRLIGLMTLDSHKKIRKILFQCFFFGPYNYYLFILSAVWLD